jgi:twitching motility protein PilI
MHASSAPRKGALHEFQQQLTQRMQQARREPAAAQSCMAVTTGARRWLFDLAHTAELLPLKELTSVPFTRDWYLGLISHRSQLTSVIDLEAFAGTSPAHWQTGDRLLVLSDTLPLRCAIRVMQVIGVVDRKRFVAVTDDTTLADWCPRSYTDADGLRWDWIDLPALMKTPAFLDIARR